MNITSKRRVVDNCTLTDAIDLHLQLTQIEYQKTHVYSQILTNICMYMTTRRSVVDNSTLIEANCL